MEAYRVFSGTYGTNGFYLPFKQDYTVEGFSTVTYKGNGANQYIGGTGLSLTLLGLTRRDAMTPHFDDSLEVRQQLKFNAVLMLKIPMVRLHSTRWFYIRN